MTEKILFLICVVLWVTLLISAIHRSRRHRVYYCVSFYRDSYVGLAKLEPFTSLHPNLVLEPGEMWFQFGTTREEAYFRIVDEMIKLGIEKDVILCGAGG